MSGKIISCAIEIHKALGPGLLESIYEECFCYELKLNNLKFKRQVSIPLNYKGLQLNAEHRIDVIVERLVIIELKAVANVLPVHEAQLLSYMKLTKISIGLLLNFNEAVLKNGIIRRIL